MRVRWRNFELKFTQDNLQTAFRNEQAKILSARYGGMVICLARLKAGTDMTPAFRGLMDDLCQCPHFGYVVRGALHCRYADGVEEPVGPGEIWYAPPGHTVWVDEDTELVEFSPEAAYQEVIDHIQSCMHRRGSASWRF